MLWHRITCESQHHCFTTAIHTARDHRYDWGQWAARVVRTLLAECPGARVSVDAAGCPGRRKAAKGEQPEARSHYRLELTLHRRKRTDYKCDPHRFFRCPASSPVPVSKQTHHHPRPFPRSTHVLYTLGWHVRLFRVHTITDTHMSRFKRSDLV